jgi:adenosylhomocysteine/aminodeoxyfutalosine nucleosidase
MDTMRLAIFSAFPQELKCILKNFKPIKNLRRHPFSTFLTKYLNSEIILVQTGMGTRNAEAAMKYILEEYGPDFILSIGFGGALYDGALIGDLVWASRVILVPEDILKGLIPSSYNMESYLLEVPDAGEIFSKLSEKVSMKEGCILTCERYIKKSEIKKHLSKDLSFPVCDMETFFLAKLSVNQGLPFFAVRSITDRADEEIPPEFLYVTDESRKYKLSRALSLILSKPKLIKDVIRTGRASTIASNNLWLVVKALTEIIEDSLRQDHRES